LGFFLKQKQTIKKKTNHKILINNTLLSND